eukprot:COSAG04_NODE_25859_length_302_cov_1.000000_1_plen_49_part_01
MDSSRPKRNQNRKPRKNRKERDHYVPPGGQPRDTKTLLQTHVGTCLDTG